MLARDHVRPQLASRSAGSPKRHSLRMGGAGLGEQHGVKTMPLTATDEFRSEVTRSRPTRVVVMLYDEAIASLEAAIEAMQRNAIEERCNREIGRAHV